MTADVRRPVLSALKYGAADLVSGPTLTATNTISLTAQDESGISRVVFSLNGNVISTDYDGGTPFPTACRSM